MHTNLLMMSTSQYSSSIRIPIATLENFAFWSTMFGVFAGSQGIYLGLFTLRPFYAVAVANLLLFIFIVGYRKLPLWVLCFSLYLALSGAIGIANETSTVLLVMKSLIGISASAFYYFYFFKMKNNTFERAFLVYTELAVWFATAALPMWLVECIQKGKYVRLHGLVVEPAGFSVIVLTAAYWHVSQTSTNRKAWPKAAILLLTLVLANSSLGFLGILVGAIFLLSKNMKRLLVLPIIVSLAAGLMYTLSPDFQLRANSTFLSIATQDLSDADGSTYALLANAYVAMQVVKQNPLLGNGLGSHVISHGKYVSGVPGYEAAVFRRYQDLSMDDSGSLLVRTLSDQGLIGLLIILIFLVHFYVGGSSVNSNICRAILVCFIVKLIRDGTYFNPEAYFFVYIYILNHRDWRTKTRSELNVAVA